MSKPQATISSPLRTAFLAADVHDSNPKLVLKIARAIQGGAGLTRRWKMWNKTNSKS